MTDRPDPGPTGGPRYEYESEVELVDYLEVVLRRKWLIILGTLACVVATGRT